MKIGTLRRPPDGRKVRRWVAAGAALAGLFWFPHALAKTGNLGYDFPLYVEAGRSLLNGTAFPHGWVYPDWTAWAFVPFTFIPSGLAFGVFYAGSLLAWVVLVLRVPWPVGVFSFYPALLGLEVGNVGVILAACCLTLPGSLLAGCFKPYLFAFVLLHAFGRYFGVLGEGGRRAGEKADADLPGDAGRAGLEEQVGGGER